MATLGLRIISVRGFFRSEGECGVYPGFPISCGSSSCRSCMVSWIVVAAAAFVFAVTLHAGVRGHGPLELSKRP